MVLIYSYFLCHNRDSSDHSDVGNHMPHDFNNDTSVALPLGSSPALHLVITARGGFLPLLSYPEGLSRWVGSIGYSNSVFHHHVHLALWYGQTL